MKETRTLEVEQEDENEHIDYQDLMGLPTNFNVEVAFLLSHVSTSKWLNLFNSFNG